MPGPATASRCGHRRVSVGERPQLTGPVPGERRPVHDRQRRRIQRGQVLQRRLQVGRQAGCVEELLGLEGGFDDVGLGERGALRRRA